MKHNCCKCNQMAVWVYMPMSDRLEKDRYFCDDCIERGCGCNQIDIGDNASDEQYKDDQGRLLPCVEYDFNEEGFENE
jgi:hypothetical protein